MRISRICRKSWNGESAKRERERSDASGIDEGRVVGCKRLWFPWQ